MNVWRITYAIRTLTVPTLRAPTRAYVKMDILEMDRSAQKVTRY